MTYDTRFEFMQPQVEGKRERHSYVDIQIDYCKWVGAPGGRGQRALIAITNRLRPMMLPVLLATARKPGA